MKNAIKLFGIIALTVIIGFSMTACPDTDDEGKNKDKEGTTSFGDKLEFSNEQVYEADYVDDDDFTLTYKPYTGADVTFYDVYGAVPKIVGGKFSFSVGAPTAEYLKSINELFSWEEVGEVTNYTDFKISDTTAKFAAIYSFDYNFDKYTTFSLYRGNTVYSDIKTSGEEVISGSTTHESVMFVYVDKPVTITGKGHTSTQEDDGSIYTWKHNDLNLSLSKGWNTVCYKFEGSFSNYTTVTYSVSNPSSLKWVYSESGGGSGGGGSSDGG